MITVEILNPVSTIRDEDGSPLSQGTLVAVSDGTTTYDLPVGGIPLEADAQTWLDDNAEALWLVAQARGNTSDVLFSARERELLIALVKVLLDEINLLRQAIVTIHPAAANQLPQRTLSQVRGAIKNKLNSGPVK